MRALRALNGAFIGFCLAAVLVAVTMSSAQRQEPTAAVLFPLLAGLVIGIPVGTSVGGTLPTWPVGFPGRDAPVWLWCGLGALIGIAMGIGWGMPPMLLAVVATSGAISGLEVAALLRRATGAAHVAVFLMALGGAFWLGFWARSQYQQREHWRRTRPAPPTYRPRPRPSPTPMPLLTDDLKALRKLTPRSEAVERVIQASRHSVEARQGIIGFLKDVPTPTKATADARFPLSQVLQGLHRYPFAEAAPALIALDKRCAHQGNVLGDRVILAIIDCDTPEGRKYVREQLVRQERRVPVAMAMLRARNPWGRAEAEAALRKRGELRVSPNGESTYFQEKIERGR